MNNTNTTRTWRTPFGATLIVLMMLLGVAQTAFAQVSAYTFAQTAGTYAPITGGTVVVATTPVPTGATAVDDTNYSAVIPFSFTFNAVSYTSVTVNSNGSLHFGTFAANTGFSGPISVASAYAGVISGLGGDLQQRFASPIGELRTETTGIAPNRVFVVQFKDWAEYTSGAQLDNYNFQIRLLENGNRVEVVYGAFTVGTVTGLEVGLRGTTNADFNNRAVAAAGTWAASTAGAANTAAAQLSATVKPASGQTYTWTPGTGCSTITLGTVVATNATVGTPYSLNAAATASTGTLSYTITPALPAGLALNPTSGLISGTPTTATLVVNYSVTASTSASCTSPKAYSFGVNNANGCPLIIVGPAFTTLSAPVGANVAGYQFTVTGGTAPQTFAVTGTLPPGLSLSSSGLLTGTIGGPAGAYVATITATSAGSPSGCTGASTYAFAISAAGCPTGGGVTFSTTPGALTLTSGVPITPIIANATPATTFTYALAAGVLPVGLVIGTTGVTGTPTAPNTSGTFSVSAISAAGCVGVAVYTYNIPGTAACPTAVVVTPATGSPAFSVGTAVNIPVSATGGPPIATGYTYALSGTLPAGLTFAAGAITGTPTSVGGGSFTITATSTPGGCTGSATYTYTVVIPPCPTITASVAVATASTVGAAYSLNAGATTTGGTLGYTVTPALPAGLAINATTGLISGTPTAVAASAVYNVRASTSATCFADKAFTIVVGQNLATAVDNALGNLVKVSPNPSRGDFNVDFGTINMAKSSVRVYDAQGKVVFASENNKNLVTIPLEKFTNGIYLMEVETSKGRILKRLAKQ